MQVKTVSIYQIKPYENNPRDNSLSIDKVAKSIEAYGWQQPIVVDKDGIIIVGHTRYQAALKLGLKEVPVVYANNLTKKQAAGYRIADNKTSDYSIWDNKKLLKELESLDDQIYTGFKESSVFNDVLDEGDNSPVSDNDKGVTYQLSFSTQNKTAYEKIKNYAAEVLEID